MNKTCRESKYIMECQTIKLEESRKENKGKEDLKDLFLFNKMNCFQGKLSINDFQDINKD